MLLSDASESSYLTSLKSVLPVLENIQETVGNLQPILEVRTDKENIFGKLLQSKTQGIILKIVT
jgi:hypothetical protein